MPYIPTEPVESSNLERVGYDRRTQTLRVVFHGGRVYDYVPVPETEYRALLEAESKGKFLNARIKPMYGFRNVSRPEELEPPDECPHGADDRCGAATCTCDCHQRRSCCDHPEQDFCDESCGPCDEWCCPDAAQEPDDVEVNEEGDWRPIGPHEHPQLESEPDD